MRALLTVPTQILLAGVLMAACSPVAPRGTALAQPAAAPPSTAGGHTDATAKPSLVLFLTVDQLRPDYLERWRDQLTGGLRFLVDGGHFYSKGVHDHGITETAPGHASTLSGRFPYSTGIASNSAGVNTNEAPLLEARGAGASPFRFQGTTLADWMTASDPRTKVLSVSRKDRGAILPVGRGRHQVYWYAQSAGIFTTSTYYADSLPAWVRAFNAEDRSGRYAGREWTLLLGEDQYPEPDSVPHESAGQGFTFPHAIAADSAMARNMLIGFPWMDDLTLEFAWRGVRTLDLGAGPQTDLLAVSLSTTDAVGHRFGPDSRELHDQVLRLDRALGVFLDSLFALRGRDRVIIALTADHGVAPSPEVRSSFGDNTGARRVDRAVLDPVFAQIVPLVQRSGLPLDAFEFDWPEFQVDRVRTATKEREVRAVARAFAKGAERIPGVMRVDVIDDLARADTTTDAIARRWLHMFRPGGRTIAVITLDPYNYIGGGVASHGTPHDYDARVPIIFWGAPFRAGKDSSAARVVDIAPTLAQVLGAPPTEKLDGVALTGALHRAPD